MVRFSSLSKTMNVSSLIVTSKSEVLSGSLVVNSAQVAVAVSRNGVGLLCAQL